MPRYASSQPKPPACDVEGCERPALSWNSRSAITHSRFCRPHYMAEWREANPDKVRAARERYDQRHR